MSNTYTQTMFDSIKNALSNTQQGSTNRLADILKFTPDHQYDLRLVPNIKDPSKTFFHYYTQAWTSFSTGQYISALSPQTFGENCQIAQTKFRLKNAGTEEEKRKADTIRRAENWLVNVYVVNDPTSPENNGNVKIMRFGKQLHKIIMDSIQDEDESAVGYRAFDLTGAGCNFRVKVDRQGEYPSYVTSKFLLPSEIANMTDEKINEVCENIYDLESVFKLKTEEETKQMLTEHFYCTTDSAEQEDDDEDVPMDYPVNNKVNNNTSSTKTNAATTLSDDSSDEVMEKLLAGLDD